MSYEYETRLEFRGDARKALDFARNLLASMNFTVSTPGQGQLTAENTNWYLNSKQNPLLGVSRLAVSVIGTSLVLNADLAKVKTLMKIVAGLILLIDTVTAVALGIVFWKTNPEVALIALAAILPWPVVLPLMYLAMKRRAQWALNTFLQNVANGGE
jgi:hypothetical protein